MWVPTFVQHALVTFAVFAPQAAQETPRLDVPGSAWDRADATDFAETPGYRDLVEALLALQPAQVEENHPQPLDHALALANPESLRGAFVKVRGRVKGKHEVKLQSPIGAQTTIERTLVMIDKDRWVICDLVGNPPPFDVGRDTLELAGVFYRTVSYESQTEKQVKQVTLPYMLARSLQLVETPGSGLMKSLLGGGRELFLGVILGIVAVVVLVLYLRHSARESDNTVP
ncbi:MAG TPA: hypothetical protein VM509_07620 [Planctomycetota bacterium]|nr:hypothetical protein [Planctomycetota bacterium]